MIPIIKYNTPGDQHDMKAVVEQASEIAGWSQRSNVVQQYIKSVVTSRLSGTAILLLNVDARQFLSQERLVHVEHHLEAPVVPRWSKTTVKNAFYDALWRFYRPDGVVHTQNQRDMSLKSWYCEWLQDAAPPAYFSRRRNPDQRLKDAKRKIRQIIEMNNIAKVNALFDTLKVYAAEIKEWAERYYR